MIIVKSGEEIEIMRESSLIVSKTLGMLAGEVKPGVTTLHLDTLAEEFIRDHQAIPGFLGLYDFSQYPLHESERTGGTRYSQCCSATGW